MKRLTAFLFVLLAGCASPALSPADSTDSYTSESIPVTELASEADADDDLFAWAHYSRKSSELDFKWKDEKTADSYRIYDMSNNTTLGEVQQNTFTCPFNDIRDNMVFRVERINGGEADGQAYIHMNRTDKGGLSLDDSEKKRDTDGDGLCDIDEIDIGTDRLLPDTDGDGLPDGFEYYTLSTDPVKKCSQGSEKTDGETDFDHDGLNNIEEYLNGTNPYNGDSDEDGFPDAYEVHNGMDPITPDAIVIDREKAESIADLDKDDIMMMNSEFFPDDISGDDYMGYMTYEISMGTNDYGYLESLSSRYYDKPIENARDALYSLYALRTLTGIHDPADDLVFSGPLIDRRFDRYYFDQIYKGILVCNHTVFLTVYKRDGNIELESLFIPTEVLDRIDITPTVTEDDLFDIALRNAARTPEKIVSSTLYIFADMDEEPYLGYMIYTDKSEYMQIDAHTGEVTNQGNTYVE